MSASNRFEETRIEVMHDLVRSFPLASLITFNTSALTAVHIPLHLSTDPAPLGTLRGHVDRSNAVLKNLEPNIETLAIFQGPNDYITPSWYMAKQESGKVVPTWDYVVVHAHGWLHLVDDRKWMLRHLETMTEIHEARFPQPWALSDAPADYIDALLGNIIGIEIQLTRMLGRWKVSQNRPLGDRQRVAGGLRSQSVNGVSPMADIIEKWDKSS